MPKSRSYGGMLLVTIVVIVAAGAVWYYASADRDREPEYATTTVNRGDIIQAVTATGDLQPVLTVDVGAQVSGQIKEVLVDFNSKVKAGDVLALIDPAPAQQRLLQAQADLESAKANNQLLKITADRTAELFQKHLVSQSDLDTANAQLAQSNATLLTRNAAVENAKLDLQHCTITAPIDGMVLSRNTDPGRTVNASMNAPVLFTLVNDLTKMQINAAVAEADVGSITDGQPVNFTVDAFPNRTFHGTVRQVRNAATTNQSVVSYATIIDVNNADLKLKPGMTANVSIIIAQKTDVLRISNAALRARIPQELLPPSAATPKSGGGAPAKAVNPQESRQVMRSAMTEAGIQFGTPPTPEQTEKFKKIAKDKGLDDAQIERAVGFLGRSGGQGGGFGRRNGNGGGGSERGAAAPVTTRTVYKLINGPEKKLEAVSVRLGISDGVNTEVLGGLQENEVVVTSVTIPGSASTQAPAGRNPFQQGRGFGGFRGR